MRALSLLWLAVARIVVAQAPTPARAGNQTVNVITTTITSLVTPSPNGTPSPTTLVLTLTLNSTIQNVNTTSINATAANSTLTNNGTLSNTTQIPWNSTAKYLPFKIQIDPAYGTLGALLIISGIPVAALGGKNRWSSNAIVTGYCLMLFSLVLILRFGVEPNLQPPSPNPPSRTLRGLYLLAGIISAFFGGALGIFLYNLARHWVSAAGGFAFGWFLLATKKGGLINNVLGRWFLLGGLAVLGLVASLPKSATSHVLLLSTAWIGATAFVLGVDCFTRAGLKEFYVYNLGFYDLFPKLNGDKYPLTQTMEIELGILAAVVIMGAAIQFRVLNLLQKRLREAREEEEARIDNEEVTKAAERFKNTETELDAWEKKHGAESSGTTLLEGSEDGEEGPPIGRSMTSGDRSSVLLPQLGFEAHGDKRESLLSFVKDDKAVSSGVYDRVPLTSPTGQGSIPGTPLSSRFSAAPSPGLTDSDLDSKINLLAEVRKAREEVRSSIDKLRSSTPAGSVYSNMALNDRAATPASMLDPEDMRARRVSVASSHVLDGTSSTERHSQSHKSVEWERYLQERRMVTPSPSSAIAMPRSATLANDHSTRSSQQFHTPGSLDRRERTQSMLEPGVFEFGARPPEVLSDTLPPALRSSRSNGLMLPPPVPMPRRSSYHDNLRAGAPQVAPIITGSAANSLRGPASAAHPGMRRTMTFEELAERHQKRMTRLQEPVTTQMTQQIQVDEARAKWERQQKREKEQMRAREAARQAAGSRAGADGQARERPNSFASALDAQASRPGKQDAVKKADEWRRSVASDLHLLAGPSGTVGRRSGDQRRKQTSGSHVVN